MSPPGKNNGLTTELSVVITSGPSTWGRLAPSSRRFKIGFPKIFSNSFRNNCRLKRAPSPWANRMWSWTGRGDGQVKVKGWDMIIL